MSILRLGKENWARTSFTTEGIVFILLSFIVGFSAINTTNNLLYLIFGVMISLVVISGVISMINLSRIDIGLANVPDIHALTPSYLNFRLKNDKSFIPSMSLTLRMQGSGSYMLYLPPGSEKELMVKCFLKKRGWNEFDDVTLETRFPFGFFKKWIKADLSGSRVLVFPRLNDVEIEDNPDTLKQSGRWEQKRAGHSEELRSIRDYSSGDNKKDIDWKSTAKVDKIMVKEFLSTETRNAEIRFDPDGDNFRDLEHYISDKASLLVENLKRGLTVDFIIGRNGHNTVYNSSQGRRILTFLALYER